MCCTRLAGNTGRKNDAKNRHLGSIAQLCRAQLDQAIRYHATDLSSEAVMKSVPETDCYVLDDGFLLHRLPWKTGD